MSECALYCVATPTRRIPEFVQFESAKSMLRYSPAKGRAAMQRQCVSASSGVPSPEVRMTASTSSSRRVSVQGTGRRRSLMRGRATGVAADVPCTALASDMRAGACSGLTSGGGSCRSMCLRMVPPDAARFRSRVRASGLEAFKRFMGAMPADGGIAFALIPHLDPNHASLMVELLAKHTRMPIHEAGHGMAIERNHVYVIPPKHYLAFNEGVLELSRPPETRGRQTAIDFSLRSLAG